MTKIKICGLKRPEDITYVNKFLPEFAGFVFAESRRQINAEQARRLKNLLSPDILAVGVFVNSSIKDIAYLYQEHIIDLAQLHGDETEAYMDQLKMLCPRLPLIKAVRVRNTPQILKAEKLPCDYLLLDTWQKDTYGGSGKSFDKSLIPALKKPYFLAGGLNADNVLQNISLCNPYAVDVSSAVESEGCKDEQKIEKFIANVRLDSNLP